MKARTIGANWQWNSRLTKCLDFKPLRRYLQYHTEQGTPLIMRSLFMSITVNIRWQCSGFRSKRRLKPTERTTFPNDIRTSCFNIDIAVWELQRSWFPLWFWLVFYTVSENISFFYWWLSVYYQKKAVFQRNIVGASLQRLEYSHPCFLFLTVSVHSVIAESHLERLTRYLFHKEKDVKDVLPPANKTNVKVGFELINMANVVSAAMVIILTFLFITVTELTSLFYVVPVCSRTRSNLKRRGDG